MANEFKIKNGLGVGIYSPTAYVHIKPGTLAASTAPIKLSSGVNLTTPEVGAIEYDGTHFTYTDNLPVRQILVPSAYGSMYEDNLTGSTITLTTAGSFYGWTTATTTTSNLVQYINNAIADRLTVLSGGDGDYLVNVNGVTAFGNANRVYTIAIYKNNGIVSTMKQYLRSSSTSTWLSINITDVLVGLIATDFIDIRFSSASNGDSVILHSLNAVMTRINR